jgi:citrate lyase subunit beta/citryl-CoA lyase
LRADETLALDGYFNSHNTMRSKLFVPASRPELFSKALAGQADAISFDLEDAVEASQKHLARDQLKSFLQSIKATSPSKLLIVRVNSSKTSLFAADINAVVCSTLDVLNLPMVESADEVRFAANELTKLEAERDIKTQIRILANIESPRGLRLASDIACSDTRLMGLQVGFGDLLSPLSIDPNDLLAIHSVLMSVRLAAGEACIDAYDGAYPNISDPEGFERSAIQASRLGYRGKSCIHPSQVALANRTFRPSQADIEHSLRVVEIAEKKLAHGVGAFVVDGKLLDGPLIVKAQTILMQARSLNLI